MRPQNPSKQFHVGAAACHAARHVLCSLALALCSLRVLGRVLQDQVAHCAEWAVAGECDANGDYMRSMCAQSCAERDDVNCAAWAASGECDTNPAYMTQFCAPHCGKLASAPQTSRLEHSSASTTGVADAEAAGENAVAEGAVLEKQTAPQDPPKQEDCKDHPGGCRCFFDALADGCPSAVSQGGILALCSCEYRDNTWLRVLTYFLRFFGAGLQERAGIVSSIVEEKGFGTFSVDAGLKERLQCSQQLANVWPGTLALLDFDEVGKMANSIFFPQVQQTLYDICAPGRLMLGLLCQHIVLHKGDAIAAQAYAEGMLGLVQRIGSCIESNTPLPKLPALEAHLRSWRQAQIPASEDPRAVSLAVVQRLSWWPPDLHAKQPGQPGVNLWPCAPMRDPLCWPPGAQYNVESCEHCCDPAHGPQGKAMCFAGAWSFARCCSTPGDRGYY